MPSLMNIMHEGSENIQFQALSLKDKKKEKRKKKKAELETGQISDKTKI